MEINGKLLARNTFLNLIGQIIPILIAIITIPYLLNKMGTERFGILSLIWVILSYFSLFDLGLSRAIIKFVAEAFGKGEKIQVPNLIWTAILIQTVLGLIGTLIIILITPLFVERILIIPTSILKEVKTTFIMLALTIPMITISTSLFGFLEALQRFGLFNWVKIPTLLSLFLLPLVGVYFNLNLPSIIGLICIVYFISLVILFLIITSISPEMKILSFRFSLIPQMLKFGGWITLSNVINPILVYIDRFLIGALISIGAVPFYTAPFDVVSRLLIIPASLTRTLFPTFSYLQGTEKRDILENMFGASIQYLLLTLGPLALIVVLFSSKLLQIWLGNEFSSKSNLVLQILVSGVFMNSLATIPIAFLHSISRPDIPAKVSLLELPLYGVLALILIRTNGLVGAAMAWTIRVSIDAILLFIICTKIPGFSIHLNFSKRLANILFSLMVLFIIAYILKWVSEPLTLMVQIVIFSSLLFSFGWFQWEIILNNSDRETLLKALYFWTKNKDSCD